MLMQHIAPGRVGPLSPLTERALTVRRAVMRGIAFHRLPASRAGSPAPSTPGRTPSSGGGHDCMLLHTPKVRAGRVLRWLVSPS